MRAEISGFLQQLRFEVTRKDFNTAALQCELHLRSRLENQAQVAKARDELLAGVLWWMGISQGYLLHSDLTFFFLLRLCMLLWRLCQLDSVIVIFNCENAVFVRMYLQYHTVYYYLVSYLIVTSCARKEKPR